MVKIMENPIKIDDLGGKPPLFIGNLPYRNPVFQSTAFTPKNSRILPHLSSLVKAWLSSLLLLSPAERICQEIHPDCPNGP